MTHESDSSEKSETAVESFNLGRSRRGERLASVKKKKVLKKQTKTKETRSCLFIDEASRVFFLSHLLV